MQTIKSGREETGRDGNFQSIVNLSNYLSKQNLSIFCILKEVYSLYT